MEKKPVTPPKTESKETVGWQIKLATQPERIAQAMDDWRNEENHRPSPGK